MTALEFTFAAQGIARSHPAPLGRCAEHVPLVRHHPDQPSRRAPAARLRGVRQQPALEPPVPTRSKYALSLIAAAAYPECSHMVRTGRRASVCHQSGVHPFPCVVAPERARRAALAVVTAEHVEPRAGCAASRMSARPPFSPSRMNMPSPMHYIATALGGFSYRVRLSVDSDRQRSGAIATCLLRVLCPVS